MKEIRDIVSFCKARHGQPLVLATLVAADGSSYRRPGARMLIDAVGHSAGGVSAGCIEEEVIACSREVFRTHVPRLMSFDTRRRFGCHGTISILVEIAPEEVLRQLEESARERQSCRLATVMHGHALGTRLLAIGELEGAFVQTIHPVIRLVLIGDGSDTLALRAQATLLGWDVIPPGTDQLSPDLLDDRTAVVIATHHFGRDCALLRSLLPMGIKYLGLIGSRRRRDDLLFDVIENGVSPTSSLFAPAGLHLGADSPQEIALSIVAEIQSVFAEGTGQQLRHRKAPIHQPAASSRTCAESPASY